MKVLCRYSGVEFKVENFPDFTITGAHPLMYAPTKQLLARCGDFYKVIKDTDQQFMNDSERRLLFIALLKSTELVDFEVPLNPSMKTIYSNFEFLVRTIGWRDAIGNAFPLPRFAVRSTTADMSNIRHWLNSWNEAREDWLKRGARDVAREKMIDREKALSRMIRSATRSFSSYSAILSKWALAASNAPDEHCEYWTQLFALKGFDIYNANQLHLQELLEYMQMHLNSSSIVTAVAIKHLAQLAFMNKNGINYSIGMTDAEGQTPDENELNKLFGTSATPYHIISDIEQHNIQVITANAPLIEPLADSFSNRVDYLRARAKWNIANRQRIVLAEQAMKAKELQNLIVLDEIDLPTGEIEEVDPNQLGLTFFTATDDNSNNQNEV